MALNPTPVGNSIAALIQSSKPAAGDVITDSELQTLWEGIISIIYTDLKANLQIDPGSFVAPTGGGAITGLGGPAE